MPNTSCGQALISLQLWLDSLNIPATRRWRTRAADPIPVTSELRQLESNNNKPRFHRLFRPDGEEETVLYLGYGSNLSAETFRGRRGIQPVSQVNVVVPTLSLTFDLPGIPYSEPCFGNVRLRDPNVEQEEIHDVIGKDYHKDHWPKGLVGVVYEVTRSDYVHIIATEGGGSGYQDVLVDCYALSGDPSQDVPFKPAGQPFKAHTLFAPSQITRPDHSYAQPSPRYLKLITDGATEHGLPLEYQAFLQQIRTFHLTTSKQQVGQFIFLSVWSPFFLFFIGGAAAIFLRPDGTYPKWFAEFLHAMFTACWASYDHFFKKTFGDGERTIGDETSDHNSSTEDEDDLYSEKEPLIERTESKYGTVTKVERLV